MNGKESECQSDETSNFLAAEPPFPIYLGVSFPYICVENSPSDVRRGPIPTEAASKLIECRIIEVTTLVMSMNVCCSYA